MILRSDQLWIYVLLTALSGRWLRLVLSGVLLVPLSLHPALWDDHLLGAVRRRTQEGFDVVVVHHLAL